MESLRLNLNNATIELASALIPSQNHHHHHYHHQDHNANEQHVDPTLAIAAILQAQAAPLLQDIEAVVSQAEQESRETGETRSLFHQLPMNSDYIHLRPLFLDNTAVRTTNLNVFGHPFVVAPFSERHADKPLAAKYYVSRVTAVAMYNMGMAKQVLAYTRTSHVSLPQQRFEQFAQAKDFYRIAHEIMQQCPYPTEDGTFIYLHFAIDNNMAELCLAQPSERKEADMWKRELAESFVWVVTAYESKIYQHFWKVAKLYAVDFPDAAINHSEFH